MHFYKDGKTGISGGLELLKRVRDGDKGNKVDNLIKDMTSINFINPINL